MSLLLALSSVSAQEPYPFSGCVFDRQTGAAVEGAAIQVWSPGGGAIGLGRTERNGCLQQPISIGYPPSSGGFIEAVARIRGRVYRQQYLIPTNVSANTGAESRYDFFLDTLPRRR